MSSSGYYSLLQYCPDMSRLEAANVGVLLVSAAHDFADIMISTGHDRVRRFFKSENIDYEGLNAAKVAIRNRVRLEKQRFQDVSELAHFVNTRGNDLVLTPPRPVRVFEPHTTLSELFRELVGGRHRELRLEPKLPELDRVLRHPSLEGKVQFDRRVKVPVVGRKIIAPYAFQNGRLNLVKPEHFSASEKGATNLAMRLAVEGDLLNRYETEEGEQAALVVVADYEDPHGDARGRVELLLKEYGVRSFDHTQLNQLVEEIERTAH